MPALAGPGGSFTGREAEIARDLLVEIGSRLRFLGRGGPGLPEPGPRRAHAVGGEAQRIRLAAQLGSNLQGVCYVLDEPTIGLHPHDNQVLLDTLDSAARQAGNTLLVVEHDEDTIRRADHVIDIGPGAGKRLGGRIMAEGRHGELMRNAGVDHRPLPQRTR
jgi:excinuclease ABC subunit A